MEERKTDLSSEERMFEAKLEALPDVHGFVSQVLTENNLTEEELTAIDVAVEELFVNVANYAYGSQEGSVLIRVSVDVEIHAAFITLIDQGVPFDPLESEEPGKVSSPDQLRVGGLGLYIVKESVDALIYEYKEGSNIVTIRKNFGES